LVIKILDPYQDPDPDSLEMLDPDPDIQLIRIHNTGRKSAVAYKWLKKTSVGNPEPVPQDPHVFGPSGSGSGSISQEFRIRLRILPFSHKCVERTEIMHNKILTQNLWQTIKFVSLKMMRLWASYKKKYKKNIFIFFASLKSMRK
jgi:hypothetical protein